MVSRMCDSSSAVGRRCRGLGLSGTARDARLLRKLHRIERYGTAVGSVDSLPCRESGPLGECLRQKHPPSSSLASSSTNCATMLSPSGTRATPAMEFSQMRTPQYSLNKRARARTGHLLQPRKTRSNDHSRSLFGFEPMAVLRATSISSFWHDKTADQRPVSKPGRI